MSARRGSVSMGRRVAVSLEMVLFAVISIIWLQLVHGSAQLVPLGFCYASIGVAASRLRP
jgi:hypothetical protein